MTFYSTNGHTMKNEEVKNKKNKDFNLSTELTTLPIFDVCVVIQWLPGCLDVFVQR